MKLKFAIPASIATTAACLAFAQPALGQAYTETGDAGDLPATAQIITGVADVTFTSIVGATTPTNALYDSDMYEITVAAPGTYTFSTNYFVSGKNDFDSQLALFNSTGVGIATDDDAPSGGDLSTLVLTLTPGNYYLLLSGSGRYAIDANNALIFPNYTDGVTDPSKQQAATSALAISGYTGNSNEGGAYSIAITYAAPVPEPGTYGAVLVGFTGLALVGRLRRRAVS